MKGTRSAGTSRSPDKLGGRARSLSNPPKQPVRSPNASMGAPGQENTAPVIVGTPTKGFGTPAVPVSETLGDTGGGGLGGSPAAVGSGDNAGMDGATGGQAIGEDGMPMPLLYVDVNIAPGQPPERIVLREGQSVNEVAAEFAARHALTPVLAQRLHARMEEVLAR